MRTRILSILAYTGAGLTLLIAVCVPFVLIGIQQRGGARGAAYRRDVHRRHDCADDPAEGYRIEVYQPVQPRMLERTEPFVQIVFEPADALPARVNDEIDLDGDGRPDVRVSFSVPADTNAKMHGDVTALNGGYVSLSNASDESFSRMVVRTGNKIVVRVPVR